ncbi:hypothetical protein HF086_008813 [Spodoptera exigua]|uniref:HTH CENPB-type domain-containing protein n=1 Tax=Spodoptera exigua TaxID=7107 RepID=A0A922SLV2_SPOEX|nr:hypothetical protein HF086_008813 [Spodoptera exigua]
MESAIKEVLDKTLSIRKSAQKYGVKPTTLESRLKKFHQQAAAENIPTRAFTSKFTSNQVFSTEEEALLNNYIIECSKMHYGLTIIQVRKLAYEFAKANQLNFHPSWHHNKMAGKEWLDSFRRRNGNLSLRKPENTSAARSFAFNKTAVTDFYNNLEKVLTKYKFTADRIFNFDESGISTVLSTPKVLAEKNQKQIGQLVSAERGELVTFGGIISASEVLKHIQKKSSCSKDNPILLLVDNHESHVTIEAVNYARDNGIVYLSFPPYTTHRLQPLDIGVFGPFKAKLKIAFNDWHLLATTILHQDAQTNPQASTSSLPQALQSTQDEQSSSAAVQDYDVPETKPADPIQTELIQQNLPSCSSSVSPSLLSPTTVTDCLPAVGLITPELEEIEKGKLLKKEVQEKKQKAKAIKKALHLVLDADNASTIKRKSQSKESFNLKKQKKTTKTDSEDETDYEDETDCEDEVSLRESSSPAEEVDDENETPVLAENIEEKSFVLVKFEKKKSVILNVVIVN